MAIRLVSLFEDVSRPVSDGTAACRKPIAGPGSGATLDNRAMERQRDRGQRGLSWELTKPLPYSELTRAAAPWYGAADHLAVRNSI